MAKEVVIEGQIITMIAEDDGIRVKVLENNIILANQTMDNVDKIINSNFYFVYNFYAKQISNFPQFKFEISDTVNITLKIVLYYLYVYNTWKVNYKKSSYQNLLFRNSDFYNNSTYDIITQYCKNTDLADWEQKASVLMGLSLPEFLLWYQKREKFYGK